MAEQSVPGLVACFLHKVRRRGAGILPAHSKCNKDWDPDQQFVRLRLVMHAGSHPSARYVKERELLRLSGSKKRKPQPGRYANERAKSFVASGIEYNGFTDDDYSRLHNVVRHWAAGIHFSRTNASANLPGEIDDTVSLETPLDPAKLKQKLAGRQEHVWMTKDGEFARWYFVPGPTAAKSVVAIRLLDRDTLWFLVRF